MFGGADAHPCALSTSFFPSFLIVAFFSVSVFLNAEFPAVLRRRFDIQVLSFSVLPVIVIVIAHHQ